MKREGTFNAAAANAISPIPHCILMLKPNIAEYSQVERKRQVLSSKNLKQNLMMKL